jgi:hypothetical protein
MVYQTHSTLFAFYFRIIVYGKPIEKIFILLGRVRLKYPLEPFQAIAVAKRYFAILKKWELANELF